MILVNTDGCNGARRATPCPPDLPVSEHSLQLCAMAGEFVQGGGAFIQRGLCLRGGLPAKLREQSRINAIGLGAEGAGFGEVPDAGRLHHRHRDAGSMERGHKGLFISGWIGDQEMSGVMNAMKSFRPMEHPRFTVGCMDI
jgi:hypothetical protein